MMLSTSKVTIGVCVSARLTQAAGRAVRTELCRLGVTTVAGSPENAVSHTVRITLAKACSAKLAIYCLLGFALFIGLSGCQGPRSSTQFEPRVDVMANEWPPALVPVPLVESAQPVTDIEVGVVLFDAGVESDDARAHAALRRVEASLLAARLRDTLVTSGQWGAVRVLPEPSAVVAVTLAGTVVHSDGRDLVLDIQASDATGRQWFSRRYHAQADAAAYPVRAGSEPFALMYTHIANDLLIAMGLLTEVQQRQLPQIAQLLFAQQLAPSAFVGYMAEQDGSLALQRLPAVGDPMLARIERIRQQEYLFIDTVDDQYVELLQALTRTYDLWRQSTWEQAEYLADYQQRASQREINAERGSFAAMQQVYATYRSVKVQEQDLFELAKGFGNEVQPTVLETNDRVFRLTGTLGSQYREWRSILAQIFALESGT